VVFGCGQDKLPVNDELVRRVLAEKRPAPAENNDWLTADWIGRVWRAGFLH